MLVFRHDVIGCRDSREKQGSHPNVLPMRSSIRLKKLRSLLVLTYTRKTTRWEKCSHYIVLLLFFQLICFMIFFLGDTYGYLTKSLRWGLKIWKLEERETLMLLQRYMTIKLYWYFWAGIIIHSILFLHILLF